MVIFEESFSAYVIRLKRLETIGRLAVRWVRF